MDDSNFKMSMFGGFNKKSVVEYVTKLVNDFNLESEKLKKDYESKIQQKDEQILNLTKELKLHEDELKDLKNKLKDFENSDADCDSEKLFQQLEEKDVLINKLTCELSDLKNRVNESKDEHKFFEERAAKAKIFAKERVNKIIEQARLKIADEYDKKIEKSNRESQLIRSRAVKEASQILSDVSVVAQKIMLEFKEKFKNYVESVKGEAESIVDSASFIGQKIVKNSTDWILNRKKQEALNSVDLEIDLDKFDVENDFNMQLKDDLRVENELMSAVEKLNADLILDDESKKIESDDFTDSKNVVIN